MSPRRRNIPLKAIIPMVLMWLLLWASYGPVAAIGGVLAAIVVLYVFPLPTLDLDGRFRPFAFIKLWVVFAYDLVTASVQIAWWSIRPKKPPLSAIIEVRLQSESTFILTFTAEMLSLIPGSVVVEASQTEHTLYLHVFGVSNEDDIARVRRKIYAQELRIVRAIGSDAELANYGGEAA